MKTEAMATETHNASYKFVVGSAEEAVKVLRERLGEKAKVVSVRQVESGGLARFLRAPKLEVIARIEEEESREESVVPAEDPGNDFEPMAAPPSSSEKLLGILQKAGLSQQLLARLKREPAWAGLSNRELRSALNEVAVLMRLLYQSRARRPLEKCVAFIGTPGVGKTTALCKRLAADVFLRQKPARVLKLDVNKANPADGLAVFCEALGVPMLREGESIDAIASEGEGTLYVDLPGVSPGNASEAEELAGLIGEKNTSRVLVLNAAYELSLMKQAYALGEKLGATHIGFTHLDELSHWGKLWEFLLAPGNLQPLFLGFGQNIAGDFAEDVFDSTLAKTFPEVGKEFA